MTARVPRLSSPSEGIVWPSREVAVRYARLFVLVALVVGLVGCDHATKLWAETRLQDAPRIELVPQVLDLSYTRNHDVAFNALRAVPPDVRHVLMLLGGLLALPAIALFWRRNATTRVQHAGWGLLLAGAVGNVLDRVFRGYVVDFIHLHHWPVFNVADAAIVVGVLLLLFAPQRQPLSDPPDTT
jgi:signal peptidase II